MKSRRRSAVDDGFTLLEMVVALAVFAVIGVMASRIVAGLMDLVDVTRVHGDALVQVQRAINIVERDVEQLVHRSVRDELGDPKLAVSLGEGWLVELTRKGWQNPLGVPRSDLQRVAYVHDEDRLARLYWPMLDRAPSAKPTSQVLLSGVFDAAFVAYDRQGEQHAYWPPQARRDDEDGDVRELAAIELRLGLESHGRIERLWLVPAAPDFLKRRDRRSADDGDEADEPLPRETEDDEDWDDEDWDDVEEP